MEYNSKSNVSTFRRIMLALALVLALPFYGVAQNVISGTVTDEQGEPLIGVSVLVKESKAGVSTDIDGNYSVKANKGQTLMFSYIGMVSQEIKV
ncbi:MAG: carboxypeptidase-like regulatory domain-containing protein, partial [Muribaculaceae bacterium]